MTRWPLNLLSVTDPQDRAPEKSDGNRQTPLGGFPHRDRDTNAIEQMAIFLNVLSQHSPDFADGHHRIRKDRSGGNFQERIAGYLIELECFPGLRTTQSFLHLSVSRDVPKFED